MLLYTRNIIRPLRKQLSQRVHREAHARRYERDPVAVRDGEKDAIATLSSAMTATRADNVRTGPSVRQFAARGARRLSARRSPRWRSTLVRSTRDRHSPFVCATMADRISMAANRLSTDIPSHTAVSASASVGLAANAASSQAVVHSGWVLKKRRKKMQGA